MARATDIINLHGRITEVMRVGWLAHELGIPVAKGNTTLELGVHTFTPASCRSNPCLTASPRSFPEDSASESPSARAIVRRPDDIIFDQPLVNLDAELRVQMRIEMAFLHRVLGATMVHVSPSSGRGDDTG